jgi:site-specific DNA recombinase
VNAFANSRGLVIHHIYQDKAESGAREDRKELRRLLRDCDRGSIGMVIIPSLDRLSRDVRIAENLFWKFDRLSVRVLIADMPFYDGTNRRDVLVRQIREAIAEENRKDIIERLWKGRQERVRQGKPPGGTAPYGFERLPRRGLMPEPNEADVVRLIFELFDACKTRTAIADVLNERGKKRRNGAPWTRWQIAAIIRRRKLYEEGALVYGEASGSNEALILLKNRSAA